MHTRHRAWYSVDTSLCPADVYTFDHSAASHDGSMRGLALDEVNHPEYTEGRIRDWAEIVRTA